MNLNAAVEALDSVRFFDCRMADMEGVEPSPLSRTREGLQVAHPFDSFPDYRLGNQAQGWTDTLLLILNQLSHR